MGRHSAVDGESPHPLVAAALAGRTGGGDGAHRSDLRATGEQGEVGWPGPPAREGGGGLGWPGGGQADAAAVPVPRRSGWRRLLGAAPAA